MNPAETASLAKALPAGTGVCVINLDLRSDRWDRFNETVSPWLGGMPVQRISATLGVGLPGYGEPPFFRRKKRDRTWGARGGCVLSHRDAIAYASSQGWTHALILEDDVELDFLPSASFNTSLRDALERIGPDVCYLGFTDPVPPYKKVSEIGDGHALYRVFGCNTAHAYLVNRKAMDWIVARLPERAGIWPWLTHHRAVDRFYYRNFTPSLTVAAISAPLISQTVGFSDIVGKDVGPEVDGHLTRVPDLGTSEADFLKGLVTTTARFRRDGFIDLFRGFIKRQRGF